MYSSSQKMLALVLAIGLCSFIPSVLKAQDHQCCPPPPPPPPTICCPPPPICVQPPVCCAPPVLEKPCAAQPMQCCPVDPKEVRKAQRRADHAAHEAAEACHRQQ